jgi:TonB family protein
MSFRPLHRKATLLTFCLAILPLASARAAESPGGPDPTIEKKLAEAEKLFAKKDFKKAAAELRQADQLAKGQCGACLLWLVQVEEALENREGAVQAARAAVALGSPRPFAAAAWNQLGVTLTQSSADEARLTEAETSFRRAVELGDDVARINLAALQLRRHHPGKALALARQYLAAEPQGQGANSARVLACHARATLAEGTPPGSLAEAEVVPAPTRMGVEPPKVLYRQPARNDAGASGVVQLDSVIDEEGCVVDAKVPKAGKAPKLEGLALKAVRYWVFQPAIYQGHPIRVTYHLAFNTRELYEMSARANPYHLNDPNIHSFTALDIAFIRGTYERPGPPR